MGARPVHATPPDPRAARPPLVRPLLRALGGLALVMALAAPAHAVSVRDLVELSKAGLSDEVLIALIEADDTLFGLDAPKILELRAHGLSEHVITAMLRSGRGGEATAPATPPVAPASAPADAPAAGEDPYFVVIGEKPPSPWRERQTVVVVPWPIYGGVVVPRPRPHYPAPVQLERGFGRFMNNGWVERPAPRPVTLPAR